MAFAWVASKGPVARALSKLRTGAYVEQVLAALGAGSPPEASCALIVHGDGLCWIDGFEAPFGDRWREYVAALASAAVERARLLGCDDLKIDVYEFGAAREPLEDLGFAAEQIPPHFERNRVWHVRL